MGLELKFGEVCLNVWEVEYKRMPILVGSHVELTMFKRVLVGSHAGLTMCKFEF